MNPSHMSGGKPPPQQQQGPPPGMLAQQLQMQMRPRQPMTPPTGQQQSPGPGQMMLGPPRGPMGPVVSGVGPGGSPMPPMMSHRAPPPQHPQQQLQQHHHQQQGSGLAPSVMSQQQQQHHQQQILQQQRAQAAAAMAQQPLTLICRFGAEFTQEIVSKTLEVIGSMRALTLPANINHLSPGQLEEKKGEVRKMMTAIRLCFDRLRQMYDRCGQIDIIMEIGEMRPTEVVMENIIPLLDDEEDSDGVDLEDEDAQEDDQLKSKSEEEKTTKDGLQPAKKAKHAHRSKAFADQRYRGPKIDDERRRKNPKIAVFEAEYRDLLALNQLKSRQMKEIIDRLRKLVWDINTMIAVSAST